MTLGLVCDVCDALSPVGAASCGRCGTVFAGAVDPTATTLDQHFDYSQVPSEMGAIGEMGAVSDMGATLFDAKLPAAAVEDAAASEPPSGDRACPNCGAINASNHKFCGECGHRLEPAGAPQRRTMYQRALAVEETGRARLVLIKGEGLDTISYHLAGVEHFVGRTDAEILFPDDQLVSPRHANFYYRGSELYVRDEGSRNGVFVRIRRAVRLEAGQPFLVGEQLLAVQPASVEGLSAADHEGTYYYGSPRRPARIRLIQILAGGDLGMALRVPGELLSIGREGNSVNFPEDPFISGHHAQVVPLEDGAFRLSDVGSKNGTFVRIYDDTRLEHGDFVFLGQQLLRVEIV